MNKLGKTDGLTETAASQRQDTSDKGKNEESTTQQSLSFSSFFLAPTLLLAQSSHQK